MAMEMKLSSVALSTGVTVLPAVQVTLPQCATLRTLFVPSQSVIFSRFVASTS